LTVDWGTILEALLIALIGGGLVSWYERKARKRQAEGLAVKIEAEAGKIEAEADSIKFDATVKTLDGAFRLIGVLTDQLKCQEKRLDEQDCKLANLQQTVVQYARRIEYLMRGIRVLLGQFEQACIEPAWRPDDWSVEDEGP
jgi:hypothetical protein